MDHLSKITTINDIAQCLELYQRRGDKIVHAHGCFDLLHLGHMKYLEAAKSAGDVLVVSVTADKYVNKGLNRPVFSQSQRAEMLAALSIVDFVLVNDHESAVPVIMAIKPKFYAKGKDYANSPDDVRLEQERKAVEAHGGKIIFTDEITFSSTELINKNLSVHKPPMRKPFDFASKRILLIGDVMLDHYVYGTAARLSPEAPVPVLKFEREDFRLGGAGTVLRNLDSLGAETTFVSVVGNDYSGNQIISLVGEVKNCIPYLIKEYKRPTTVKTRHIAGHNQIARIDNETTENISRRTIEQILSHVNPHSYDAIIISDYGKGVVLPTCQEIIKSAGSIPIIIDPKNEWFGLYSGATLITPNLPELINATHKEIKSEQDIINRCVELRNQYNIKNILVTRGADGMLLKTFDDNHFSIPAVAKEVYDVTGAGDTVVAVLALAASIGMSLIDAAKLANKAAGVVVGKVGSAAITMDELCG